jgi:enterochelin esterase-like enzyme
MAGLLLVFICRIATASELLRDAFHSAALGRMVSFTVYLPNGYKEATRPYPVVYLLHGAGGNEHEWVKKGSAIETLDSLISRGRMRPSIAIMPTAGPSSWWVNGASEQVETAFIDELIPYVEKKYKASTERSARSIGGLSMGGYGSLNMALKYPHKFCGAAIISPSAYDPLPPDAAVSRNAIQFFRNGKFDPDIWKSLNYPAHLESYKKAGDKVAMWIVSGDHDHLGIAFMSAQLYWRLHQIQPKQVELRIVDGEHDWMTFRDALPGALQYVDRQCSLKK